MKKVSNEHKSVLKSLNSYLSKTLCFLFVPGVCLCAEGWTGADCTIDLRTGPRVGALGNNGLCDVRTRPCRNLIILGDNFANRPELSCTFEVFKVNIIFVFIILYKSTWSILYIRGFQGKYHLCLYSTLQTDLIYPALSRFSR